MDYFPLFANLKGLPCLIVGGGDVAARKARELLAAGARLTVNAPSCAPAMTALLAAHPGSRYEAGTFAPALVGEHLLVVAATADPAVNRAVAAAAHDALRLCNVVDDGAASTFIVPAVVNRAPVLVAVSSGGTAPVLSRLLRQRLEQWLPRRLGPLATWAGSWRERVRLRLPDLAARREFWERLFDSSAAAAFLSGDEPQANACADALLNDGITAERQGKAWLIGAGPGDPGLISVHGLRILEQADVVLHDRLVAPELLRAARREAEIICVGKAGGRASTAQDAINALLVDRVRAGLKVCRLKGGDPLVFGRGSEEAQALGAAGLAFEIVPGISAANGCSAAAGIPLTHRGLSAAVTLATAQAAPGSPEPDWPHLAAAPTLVMYMGGSRIDDIAAALVRHGRSAATPAAVIIDGTRPGQLVLRGTLADIGARCREVAALSPALLVVGATVGLADSLAHARARSGEETQWAGLGGQGPTALVG